MTEKCENQKSFSCLASFHTLICSSLAPLKHTRGDNNMEREGTLVRSIYYGRIGSEATERLLERFGHDGSFLLRDSETVRGAYCLCVRKAPFVHTYRLIHSTNGWCLQSVSTWKCESAAARSIEVMSSAWQTDPIDQVD
ncbi:SH2 domain-containing protein 1A-like isoform X5 [Anarhichas minor]|uniref:SH2 domain-containing protein 1A-like isoform X5 n=1 Tax=Anarhichas minor TaxID=65739 RepID=UPI003F7322E0